MKPFTKTEVKVTILILLVTFLVTFINIRIALRRSRDSQRRSDVSAIADALNAFYTDYGFFPPSENGKIKICKNSNFDSVVASITEERTFDRNKFFEGLRGCDWGKDTFSDVFNNSDSYLKTIPVDPKENLGYGYLYLSDTAFFQIYTSMEGGSSEDTYNIGVVSRNLSCGNQICSFGKSFNDIPLDRSIEEHTRLLEEKRLKELKN